MTEPQVEPANTVPWHGTSVTPSPTTTPVQIRVPASRSRHKSVFGTAVLALWLALLLVLVTVGAPYLAVKALSIYPATVDMWPDTYGPAIMADSLSNTQVGGSDARDVAYRFRATTDSPLESITVYIQTGPGYSAGNRGSLLITVRSDDGSADHLPSEEVLAAVEVPHPDVGAGSDFRFLPPPALEAGSLYHIVFTNTDAAPEDNFVSLNGLVVFGGSTTDQPAFGHTDWAELIRSDGDWSEQSKSGRDLPTPIMSLNYVDGTTAGVGYMEIWVRSPTVISGTARTREVFTVSGPERIVSSVFVRLKRVQGSGPLRVHLESASGRVLADGKIPAAAIAQSSSDDPSGSEWAELAFASPLSLQSGETYHLNLSTAADSRYEAIPIRKGAFYGYGPGTYFADGIGEYDDGSGWRPMHPPWDGARDAEGDLQFYFRVESVVSQSEAVGRSGDTPVSPSPSARVPLESPTPTAAPAPTPPGLPCDAISLSNANGSGAPQITGVAVTRTPDGGAILEWNVDPPATGQVAYGPVDQEGFEYASVFEDHLLGYHRQPIPAAGQPALDAQQTYRYQICSTTSQGVGVYAGYLP